jgi:hypothetical protein
MLGSMSITGKGGIAALVILLASALVVSAAGVTEALKDDGFLAIGEGEEAPQPVDEETEPENDNEQQSNLTVEDCEQFLLSLWDSMNNEDFNASDVDWQMVEDCEYLLFDDTGLDEDDFADDEEDWSEDDHDFDGLEDIDCQEIADQIMAALMDGVVSIVENDDGSITVTYVFGDGTSVNETITAEQLEEIAEMIQRAIEECERMLEELAELDEEDSEDYEDYEDYDGDDWNDEYGISDNTEVCRELEHYLLNLEIDDNATDEELEDIEDTIHDLIEDCEESLEDLYEDEEEDWDDEDVCECECECCEEQPELEVWQEDDGTVIFVYIDENGDVVQVVLTEEEIIELLEQLAADEDSESDNAEADDELDGDEQQPDDEDTQEDSDDDTTADEDTAESESDAEAEA